MPILYDVCVSLEEVPADLVVCVATELEGEFLIDRGFPVVVTGVGAVNASYALTRFLEREGARSVIVCGIGGAYPGADISVGEVVCATGEYYGDLGASATGGFMDMQTLGFPTVRGPEPLYNAFPIQIYPVARRVPFVTVNTCTGDDETARSIALRTKGAVENMEGAAIAHVAALAGIPVGEIRGISNAVGNRNRADWRVRDAAVAAQEELLGWIRGPYR